ncbi:MAG: spore coat protein [Clostridia bacterium]|nr:spore coat protein [Clostridia bacterium]
MQDQVIMDNVLTSVKNACDIFMHGTIESSTPNVNSVFKQALNDCLCMQNEIYSKMAQKGWYPSTSAPQQQIQQTKQKYSSAN